jgi:hypothetical protein
LSCLVLSCLVLSCLVLSCLVLSCLVLSRLVSSRLVSSRLVSSQHIRPQLHYYNFATPPHHHTTTPHYSFIDRYNGDEAPEIRSFVHFRLRRKYSAAEQCCRKTRVTSCRVMPICVTDYSNPYSTALHFQCSVRVDANNHRPSTIRPPTTN